MALSDVRARVKPSFKTLLFVAAILVLSIATVAAYLFVATPVLDSGRFYLQVTNTGTKPLEFSMSISFPGTYFKNPTEIHDANLNYTFASLSEIEVTVSPQPGESAWLEIPSLGINYGVSVPTAVNLVPRSGFYPAGNYTIEHIFSTFGSRGPFYCSLASYDVQSTFGAGTGTESFSRLAAQGLLPPMLAILWTLILGLLSAILWPVYRNRFPFITLIVVELCLVFYVFVGSGTEVGFFSNLALFRLPFDWLFHDFDDHIAYNLFLFGIVGFILEFSFAIRRKARHALGLFVMPLFADSILFGSLYYIQTARSSQLQSFPAGLSFAIISLTWIGWAYVLSGRWSIRRGRDFIPVLALGIPSFGFFNWLYQLLLQEAHVTATDSFTFGLAVQHVSWGILSAISIFFAAKNQMTRNFLNSKPVRT